NKIIHSHRLASKKVTAIVRGSFRSPGEIKTGRTKAFVFGILSGHPDRCQIFGKCVEEERSENKVVIVPDVTETLSATEGQKMKGTDIVFGMMLFLNCDVLRQQEERCKISTLPPIGPYSKMWVNQCPLQMERGCDLLLQP
ncbi:hypothetical protein STEG23_028085, partial [Scotinomys teguina]